MFCFSTVLAQRESANQSYAALQVATLFNGQQEQQPSSNSNVQGEKDHGLWLEKHHVRQQPFFLLSSDTKFLIKALAVFSARVAQAQAQGPTGCSGAIGVISPGRQHYSRSSERESNAQVCTLSKKSGVRLSCSSSSKFLPSKDARSCCHFSPATICAHSSRLQVPSDIPVEGNMLSWNDLPPVGPAQSDPQLGYYKPPSVCSLPQLRWLRTNGN